MDNYDGPPEGWQIPRAPEYLMEYVGKSTQSGGSRQEDDSAIRAAMARPLPQKERSGTVRSQSVQDERAIRSQMAAMQDREFEASKASGDFIEITPFARALLHTRQVASFDGKLVEDSDEFTGVKGNQEPIILLPRIIKVETPDGDEGLEEYQISAMPNTMPVLLPESMRDLTIGGMPVLEKQVEQATSSGVPTEPRSGANRSLKRHKDREEMPSSSSSASHSTSLPNSSSDPSSSHPGTAPPQLDDDQEMIEASNDRARNGEGSSSQARAANNTSMPVQNRGAPVRTVAQDLEDLRQKQARKQREVREATEKRIREEKEQTEAYEARQLQALLKKEQDAEKTRQWNEVNAARKVRQEEERRAAKALREAAQREAAQREAARREAAEAKEREAAERAQREAARREAAKAKEREAAEKAQREAARREAVEARKREEDEKAQREAAQREAAQREAVEARKREEDEKAQREAAQREAARREAVEARKREEDEKAQREAEEARKKQEASKKARQEMEEASQAAADAQPPMTVRDKRAVSLRSRKSTSVERKRTRTTSSTSTPSTSTPSTSNGSATNQARGRPARRRARTPAVDQSRDVSNHTDAGNGRAQPSDNNASKSDTPSSSEPKKRKRMSEADKLKAMDFGQINGGTLADMKISEKRSNRTQVVAREVREERPRRSQRTPIPTRVVDIDDDDNDEKEEESEIDEMEVEANGEREDNVEEAVEPAGEDQDLIPDDVEVDHRDERAADQHHPVDEVDVQRMVRRIKNDTAEMEAETARNARRRSVGSTMRGEPREQPGARRAQGRRTVSTGRTVPEPRATGPRDDTPIGEPRAQPEARRAQGRRTMSPGRTAPEPRAIGPLDDTTSGEPREQPRARRAQERRTVSPGRRAPEPRATGPLDDTASGEPREQPGARRAHERRTVSPGRTAPESRATEPRDHTPSGEPRAQPGARRAHERRTVSPGRAAPEPRVTEPLDDTPSKRFKATVFAVSPPSSNAGPSTSAAYDRQPVLQRQQFVNPRSVVPHGLFANARLRDPVLLPRAPPIQFQAPTGGLRADQVPQQRRSVPEQQGGRHPGQLEQQQQIRPHSRQQEIRGDPGRPQQQEFRPHPGQQQQHQMQNAQRQVPRILARGRRSVQPDQAPGPAPPPPPPQLVYDDPRIRADLFPIPNPLYFARAPVLPPTRRVNEHYQVHVPEGRTIDFWKWNRSDLLAWGRLFLSDELMPDMKRLYEEHLDGETLINIFSPTARQVLHYINVGTFFKLQNYAAAVVDAFNEAKFNHEMALYEIFRA